MIAFWIVVLLLLAIALIFLLPPLLRGSGRQIEGADLTVAVYRDELDELDADLGTGKLVPETHAESKRELERRLLDEMAAARPATASRPSPPHGGGIPAVLVGVAMPLIAVAIYLYLGSPSAIDPAKTAAAVAGDPSAQQIEQMVAQLADKLRKNPDDARGWYMLARSYHAMGRSKQAVEAFAKAAALAPNDAQLLADYAEAQARANGNRLSGKPLELLQAALEIDPRHLRALVLAGTAAFNDGDYAAAIDYWQRTEKILPPDTENAHKMAAYITEARKLVDGKSLARDPSAGTKMQAVPNLSAGGAPGIAGTVSLSFALAAQVAPTDAVFVFARAMNGSRMPLAVVRGQVKDLPVTFRLDDSMAMAPAMKLSNFTEVMLVARVSKSGSAVPQSGDLAGRSGPIKVGSSDVQIIIDGVLP